MIGYSLGNPSAFGIIDCSFGFSGKGVLGYTLISFISSYKILGWSLLSLLLSFDFSGALF